MSPPQSQSHTTEFISVSPSPRWPVFSGVCEPGSLVHWSVWSIFPIVDSDSHLGPLRPAQPPAPSPTRQLPDLPYSRLWEALFRRQGRGRGVERAWNILAISVGVSQCPVEFAVSSWVSRISISSCASWSFIPLLGWPVNNKPVVHFLIRLGFFLVSYKSFLFSFLPPSSLPF